MDKIMKAFKTIYVAPAILFGLFFIYSLFSKLTGMTSFALESFGVFLDTLFYAALFLVAAILAIISKIAISKRILFLVLLSVLTYTFVMWESPWERVARFSGKVQNHNILNNLKAGDVSFIAIENTFFTQPEQISSIVTALNDSAWYTPNRECRGKEVLMRIVLQTGQVVRLYISRFCNEDAAALLFIKPLPSGWASGGNAYAAKLPSTLESLGYPLSIDH